MPTYRITDPVSQKTLRITGDKPPTEQELDTMFQKVRGVDEPKQEKKGFFGRIGESLSKRASGIGETLKETAQGKITPLETGLRVVGDIAGGAGDVAGESIATAGKALLNTATLGNADKIGQALAQSELGKQAIGALSSGMEEYNKWKSSSEVNRRTGEVIESLVDIASLIPTGRVAKTAGTAATRGALEVATSVPQKIGQGLEATTRRTISQAASIDNNTLKQIIKNPKAFGKESIANYTREPFGEKLVQVYKKLDNEVGDGGKVYESIRKSGAQVEIPQNKVLETLSEKYGIIARQDGGTVRLSYQGGGKTNLDPGDIKALETFVNTYKGDVFNANKALNARMALSDMAGYGGNVTKNVQLVANDLRQNIFDPAMKKNIKGLKEIDAKFAPDRKALDSFRKEYFVKDGGSYRLADNAISKLANLTGKGKEEALKRIKPLIPDIEEQINVSKAIENIRELAEKRVTGAYGAGAAPAVGAVLGLGAGGPVGAVVGAVASSLITDPMKIVPIIRQYALKKNMIVSPLSKVGMTINRMKKGLPLTLDEKDILSGALLYAANELKDVYENQQ